MEGSSDDEIANTYHPCYIGGPLAVAVVLTLLSVVVWIFFY